MDGARLMTFRYPGSSRGHVVIDENDCILDIVFYETSFGNKGGCYKLQVKEAVKKFIGRRLIFPPQIS